MSQRRVGIIALFVLVLLVLLAAPAAAQGGEPGKLVVGGDYTLHSGQVLRGDLGVVGGVATVEQGATVNGDVMVAGGVLRIGGRINGDIAVFGGSVTLEGSAHVTGDLVSFGGSVQRSPGAIVAGEVRDGSDFFFPDILGAQLFPGAERFEFGERVTLQDSPGRWLAGLLWRVLRIGLVIMALTALALVVSLLWPKGIEQLGKTAWQQPVVVVLVGLLSWIVGLGLVVLLAVTICLIPVALLLALTLLVAVLLSWVTAGWLVGRSLLAALNLRHATVVLEATIGTLVLAIVYFLVGVIPCTEFIFGTLIASLGLGAIVLTRFGTRPYPTPQSAPAPGEPGPDLPALSDEDDPRPPQLTA
jgi:hypothetical protein